MNCRLFIGFQWTMVMVQLIVSEVVPDVPDEVEIQIKRQEFIRSKLLDKVEDDDLDEAELERMNTTSTTGGAPLEEHSHIYTCFGQTCSVLPCCRSHKGKYLDRKRNMAGCPEVVVKQYPVLSASVHKNPLQQHIRSGI